MTNIFLQNNWLLSALEKHLWSACVQGTLSLLLVFAVGRIFFKIPPQAANWLWRLGYLKLLVAFIGLGAIALPLLPPPSAQFTAPAPGTPVANQPTSRDAGGSSPLLPAISGAEMADLPSPAVSGKVNLVNILMLIWGAGIIFFAIKTGVSALKSRALRRSCCSLEDSAIEAELFELCRQMGIGRGPGLMTGEVSGPLICGFTSPSIILPTHTLAECSREELRLILAHELAHVKRRDLIWAWLPLLAKGLFFFHPLVWLLHREWLFTQEAACDALALRHTRCSEADYGRMLLSHVVTANPNRQLIAIGIVEPYETLKRRLNAMKYLGGMTRKRQLALGILIGLFGIFGMLPWALAAGKAEPAALIKPSSVKIDPRPRQPVGMSHPLIPSIPQGIHLTYQVTSQEFALPQAWVDQRIADIKAEIKKRPNSGLEQSILYYKSRSANGPIKTNTAEYWGTMQGFMYTDMSFALAYDGKKVATGAAWYMVPDLIKQPTTERSGIDITRELSRVDGYGIPYLGIYQPGREVFGGTKLSKTQDFGGRETWVYSWPSGNPKYVLQYDGGGRLASLKFCGDSEKHLLHEENKFADFATAGGVTYPRKVIRERWLWFRGKDGKFAKMLDTKAVYRVIKVEANAIPNSFFALSTSRPHAQIEDDRYQITGSRTPGITYNYMDPALSVDEASKQAYQSLMKNR
jgi:beta-lactamase regulating signal transducer with metallopeptidase domain